MAIWNTVVNNNNNNNMNIHLSYFDEEGYSTEHLDYDETKNWIAAQLVSTFADDEDYLKLLNRIAFGLFSGKKDK